MLLLAASYTLQLPFHGWGGVQVGSFISCPWGLPRWVFCLEGNATLIAPHNCLHHNNVPTSPLEIYCPFYNSQSYLGGQHHTRTVLPHLSLWSPLPVTFLQHKVPLPASRFRLGPSMSELQPCRSRPCTTFLLRLLLPSHPHPYSAKFRPGLHLLLRSSFGVTCHLQGCALCLANLFSVTLTRSVLGGFLQPG